MLATKVTSFTKQRDYDVIISSDYLTADDHVLFIDDFLANGAALMGLIQIVNEAGATLVGAGVAIEKAFQPGGKAIRNMGVRVESLARVKSMDENSLTFCE